MEYSLPALFRLAAASTLRALNHQAVEPIPLESSPRALVSLTHLTHLVPAAQVRALVIIPPVPVAHLARALVSTHPELVVHQALAPESTHPALAPSLPSFPHLGALSQVVSTQPVPAFHHKFHQWLRGAVSDLKGDNREGCALMGGMLLQCARNR